MELKPSRSLRTLKDMRNPTYRETFKLDLVDRKEVRSEAIKWVKHANKYNWEMFIFKKFHNITEDDLK